MRIKLLWLVSILLILAACTTAPAPAVQPTSDNVTPIATLSATSQTISPTSIPEPAAPPASDLLVYQAWDGGPLPELIVRQPDGTEVRRIALPKTVKYAESIVPLAGNHTALLKTSDSRWFVVRAASGEAQELDIPTKTRDGLYLAQTLKGSGRRWALLQDQKNRYIYLIDAKTGAVTDLTTSGLTARDFKDMWLSPQEDYLAVSAGERGLWLIPTGEPAQAQRLGGGMSTYFGGFSTDGQRIVYNEVTRGKSSPLIIENLDGTGKRMIPTEQDVTGVLPVIGTDQVVMYQTGQGVWFDIGQEKVLARVSYSRTDSLRDFWITPHGNQLLFSKIDRSSSAYPHWRIEAGTEISHPLNDLEGYSFMGSLLEVHAAPYALLVKYDFQAEPPGASLAAFNVETQEVFPYTALKPQKMTELVSQLKYAGPQRFVLFRQAAAEGQQQLVLLDLSNGQSPVIAEADIVDGAVSMSDQWAAVNTANRQTNAVKVSIINTATGQALAVGDGVTPAWVVP
jgi:hypothetical protein